MQKKSLLVALFCGALCLTGCLKNEESASVAQVRIAKANELNSIADLNKAKAQAEVIYANAEATIANAEAKLREANANLVNAQAETEKVRAELLKVQVALAEVTVEEEKVKLQLLEADLEKHLAEVEAAVAKAEAEKQEWVNELNNLLAQAEVDALKNAQALLEAKQDLEEYLLTLADEKATAAKEAAVKYFDALDQVQELQKQQIQTKATKALVEAGAMEVRDAIHYQITQIDEQIAENEAKIAYLKEYQTATPEEIEEQLKEAWKALNDAYADYHAAAAAEEDAYEAFEAAEEVKSVYVDDWTINFAGVVKGLLADMPMSDYGQYGYSDNCYIDEETGVIYNAFVKYDENDEVEEILPLWTASAPGKEQYFDEPLVPSVIDGIKQPTTALSLINNRTYYPAKIEFDNIQKVFDAYAEWQEAELEEFDEKVAAYTEAQKEELEAQIEDWKAAKKYFEDYIANPTRKAMVEKAEKALEDSIPVANKTYGAERKAFEAYRDYMVKTYDVDRVYFENRYNAKKASVKADADSVNWQIALTKAKADVATAKADLEKAVLFAHEKHGAWDKAKADLEAAQASAGTDIANAKKSWNPYFNANADTVWVNGNLYNTDQATHQTAVDSTKAGTSQVSTATAKKLDEEKTEALRNAQWLVAYWTGYGNSDKAALAAEDVETLKPQQAAARKAYNEAVTAENTAKAGYYAAAGKVTEAQKAVDKALAALKKAVVDSEWEEDAEGNITTKGKYIKAVADTSYVDVVIPEEFDPEDEDNTTGQIAKYYAQRATKMAGELKAAEEALLLQLAAKMNVDPEDIVSTADATADALYKALLEAEDTGAKAIRSAFRELMKVYYYCADQDHRGWFSNEFYWANATYQCDPEHQLVSGYHWDDETETYVLEKRYRRAEWDDVEGEWVADRTHSLGGLIEDAEAILADEEQFAEDCKEEYLDGEADPHDVYEATCAIIEDAAANLAEYKAVEPAYVASVKNRNTTHAAYVEAQINTIAAEVVYNTTKAMFEALQEVQNEGMYIYSPDDDEADEEGFVWITIAEEIERLEGGVDVLADAVEILADAATQTVMASRDFRIDDADVMDIIAAIDSPEAIFEDGVSIAELKAVKAVLEQVLKGGKITLQIVIDAFDAEIAELDEKIEVYTKIAEIYKAVMNAYLGIVEDGETGPLDGEGEGDDEE